MTKRWWKIIFSKKDRQPIARARRQSPRQLRLEEMEPRVVPTVQFSAPSPPSLTSVSPSSAPVGAPATSITVTGTGFVSGSVVNFNGTPLTTIYFNPTHEIASIPASFLSTAGSDAITVATAGLPTTSPQIFTVIDTTPTLTSVSPNTTQAGNPSTTITLTGTNFTPTGTAAKFNGTPLVTTYVSSTQVTAVIPTADLTTLGHDVITVTTPSGTSGGQPFVVTDPNAAVTVQFGTGGETVNATAGTFSIPVTLSAPAFTASTYAEQGGLSFPEDLVFDSVGNLFVTNFSGTNIVKVAPNGTTTVFANTGVTGQFGLATDAADNLYVVGLADTRLVKITPTGGVSTLASGFTGAPRDVAIDATGTLYVGQGDGSILKVTPAGVVSPFVTGVPNGVSGLAFDAAGNLYAANGAGVYKVTPAGAISNVTTAASGQGIGVDPVSGNLYVADNQAGQVLKVAPDGTVTSVASGLDAPDHVAFSGGSLFVSIYGSNAVQKITPGAVTVPFSQTGGTATGADFAFTTTSPLTISAGQTTAIISGTLTARPGTADKTLAIGLGSPSAGSLGTPAANTLILAESVAATLTSVSPNSATAGSAAITITLTGTGFTNGSTANFNGTPLTTTFISPTQETAVIPASSLTTPGNDSITVVTPGGGTTAPQPFTVSNPTVQFTTASETVNEAGGTFTLTVTLSAPATRNVTIPFTLSGTAAAGAVYSGLTASPLVFTAGQSSNTITGTLLDDMKFDTNDRTLIVMLGTPTNAILGTPTISTLTITPDATTKPAVSFGSPTRINATFSIPVILSAPSEVPTTIPFTLGGTAGVSGLTADPLVIPAGQTTGFLTGAFTDGGFGGSSKTATLTLGPPTNATVGGDGTASISEGSLTVSGGVFFDYNANGLQDANDTGLGGQTVYPDLQDDNHLDPGAPSAISDSNGRYTLSNVTTGAHKIRARIAFDNVALTGAAADGISVTATSAAATGVDFGEVIFAPSAPVFVNASLFGTTNPDANTAYIHGLYRAVLGRDPRPDEAPFVQGYVDQLLAGETHQQLALDFIQSREHRTREVAFYYQNFLYRVEKDSEVQEGYWVNQFLKGVNETTVVRGFLDSTEYLGNHVGDATFAIGLYNDVLGRSASEADLGSVLSKQTAGTTHAQMIDQILALPEAQTLAVQGFFAAYLHRPASADPLSAFELNELTSGISLGVVQANVLGDATYHEFFDNATATLPK